MGRGGDGPLAVEDPRIEWLRSKTCSSLGIEEEDFNSLVNSEEKLAVFTPFLEGGAEEGTGENQSQLPQPKEPKEVKVAKVEMVKLHLREKVERKNLRARKEKVARHPSRRRRSPPQSTTGGDPSPAPPPKPKAVLKVALHHLPDSVVSKPAVYFLKLDAAARLEEEQMDELVDYGLLSEGPALSVLEEVLSQVYIPMLQLYGSGKPGANQINHDSSSADNSRNELLGNVQKFASQVSHAIQQLTGDIHLNIPNVLIDNLHKAADDYDIVSQLESALAEWTAVLASAIQRESEKVAVGKGPLAEIDFWRERNAALSSLYEQLNLPNVKRMVSVVETGSGDTNLLTSFKSQFGELTKLYVEAKDNVKFLTTLERHFKNISSGTLTQVLESLPSMMNALRMVWIISRHYSDDTRMGSLFERIANEIGDTVAEEIDVKVLFRMPPADATSKIELAKNVLEQWSEVYLKIREKIEISGRDARWEFDRKRLFDRTNYMASICGDLLQMVKVVDDFHKFLGPELKAVTGDSLGIDEVIQRVAAMVEPIENLAFDAFDKRYSSQWQGVDAKFTTDKEQIERATRAFIDTSFKKLRSAEGAFELLQNFKSIKSEGAINRQMMDKFNDILEQFSREIDTTREIFEANKHAPPVTRNQPPVAGAINWMRSLFQRIRKTMNRLTSEEDMLKEEAGHEVQRKYIALAKAMVVFEKHWFTQWRETVDNMAMQHLKQAIIKRETNEHGVSTVVVNFHPDLTRLIRETRYLDRMGFVIPDTALNVTLQEEKYHSVVEGLRSMLEHYHSVIGLCTGVEQNLLAKRLEKLEEILNPGFSPLNWNSLGIPDFVASCNKSINEFNSLVNQVQKNSSIIEKVVHTISVAVVVQEPPVAKSEESANLMDLQEFYEYIEKCRLDSVEELLHKYRTIAPLLGKIEEAVAGTNTARSPQLRAYYYYWERAIFQALNKMVLNGMKAFMGILNSRNARKSGPMGLKPPLFKVQSMLVHPEVVVQPPVTEVTKFLSRLVRNLVECTRPFVRWMDGTCLETPEQHVNNEDDEPVVFTFYWDVAANPAVIKTMLALNHTIQKTIAGVNRFMESWRKQQHLWKQDKNSVLDKFAARIPSCGEFEEKLSRYKKLANEIWEFPKFKDVDFIRISSYSLVASIRD
ncbi:hypothetical protein CYMTET_10756, partial [Cymbomonas tetramitiformis]